MIHLNLNANTTHLKIVVTVNCIILSKQIEELFLINSAHRSKSSHNISSLCMTTEGRDFICKDGVISDPAFMDMLDTIPRTRLFTANMAVTKDLRVGALQFRKNTSR